MSRVASLKEQLVLAHEILVSPQPEGLTGKQALARRTDAERGRLAAVQTLGEIAEADAVEALVDALLLAEHHPTLRNQVLASLRRSPIADVGARVAARALRLGLPLFVTHRTEEAPDGLIDFIAAGEGARTKDWCVAVCLAASFGHGPAVKRLPQVYSDPVTLANQRWLRPMLAALLSGDPGAAFEHAAPVLAIFQGHPNQGLEYTVVDVLSRQAAPDPRWLPLALELVGKPGTHAAHPAGRLVTRIAAEGVGDRLVELGTPCALAALVELGDQRARDGLLGLLGVGRLHDRLFPLRALAQLREPPWEDMALSVIDVIEAEFEVEDETLTEALSVFASLPSDMVVDRLLEAVADADLLSDAPRSKHRAIRRELRAQIEGLRPGP